eukprot:869312_1
MLNDLISANQDEQKIWISKQIIDSPEWKAYNPFINNSNYYTTPITTFQGELIFVRKGWKSPDDGLPPSLSIPTIPKMSTYDPCSYMDSDDDDTDDTSNIDFEAKETSDTINEFRNLFTQNLNDTDYMKYLEMRYGKHSQELISYDLRLFLDEIRNRNTSIKETNTTANNQNKQAQWQIIERNSKQIIDCPDWK